MKYDDASWHSDGNFPEGVPTETAATIPVAFLTAYYGLITCARLRRGVVPRRRRCGR